MIAETLAHLRANQAVTGLALIDGTVALEAAMDAAPLAAPAAYLAPDAERLGPSPFSGDDIQRVDISIAAVFAVRNVADPRGEAALTDLQARRDAVKVLLLGWVPSNGYAPLSRGNGRLLAFRNQHIWWADIYTSTFYERKP